MFNTTEHKRIPKNKLPSNWRIDDIFDRLEDFLQLNWEQRNIFYSDGESTSKQLFLEFSKNAIKTKNYIGTICFEGEQLNIFPKVFIDKEEDDEDEAQGWNYDDLVTNLIEWLSYSDKLNFPFISTESDISNTNNLMELFITVFVKYVRATIDSQPFFKYENIIEEGSTIRGKINYKDYVSKKYSQGLNHKFQFELSSFTFNNKVNIIIKAACKIVYQLTESESNKDALKKILMKMNEVDDKNCLPHECDLIHLNKLQSKYIVILSMCKMFLLNKTTSYESGRNQSFCFLFPTEILFEGFVGGFLKENLLDVNRIATQTSSTYLANLIVDGVEYGQVFNLKEDILVEKNGDLFVFDTKYKVIDNLDNVQINKKLNISEQDMRQIALYAMKRDAKRVALIYPLSKNEEISTSSIVYDVPITESKSFPIHVIKIPFLLHDDPIKNKFEIKTLINTLLNEK
ncbi:MAG: hypothetical protein RBQ97_04230 [Acholeplasma sp.]|nr:hypothetical protein [Acholeplasma sp.]